MLGLVPLPHKIEIYIQVKSEYRHLAWSTATHSKISDRHNRCRSKSEQIVSFKLARMNNNRSAPCLAAWTLKHTLKSVLRIEGECDWKIGRYVRSDGHKADTFKLRN